MIKEELSEQIICNYTYKDWRPLIELIPQIQNTSKFGELVGGRKADGVIRIPYYAPVEIVRKFRDLCYDIPIVIVFDWKKLDKIREMRRVDFDFDSVDIVTKCKLITAILRYDRFCEGALLAEFNSGLILKVLQSIERQITCKYTQEEK